MTTMRTPLSLAVMLAVSASMAAQEAPVEPTDATAFQVRSVPALRAQHRATMAKLAKPSWHTVPDSGSSLRTLLQSVCGRQGAIVDEVLESEMLRLNGGESLDRIVDAGSAVAVPFCLGVQAVTVKRSDTLEGLLRRHYGPYGKITVRQAVELNASSAEAADDVLAFTTTLRPGEEIVLPTSVENLLVPAQASTALTQEQIASGIEEITAVLGKAAQPVVDVESGMVKPHEYQYIEFVSTEAASNLPDCGPATTPLTFATPHLRARLDVELSLATMVEEARPAVVGVIDSGLRGLGGAFFALKYFAPNQKEISDLDPPEDRDGNLYFNDVYGINMNGPTGNGSITAYGGDPHREHGTRVASLVLGGPEWVQSAPPNAPSRVRLKIVNFSDSSRPRPVDSSLLLDAITYLHKRAKVDIVNMSLSSAQPVDGATQGIRNSWPLLFVVAAGNQPFGIDLGVKGAYPAAQGGRVGSLNERVVTVGAHDNAGRWAPFSNYSAEYVDLLAPGCAIPTADDQGGTVKEYGTSIATATVSFVAGLVRSLGETDPRAIKNRLLASVDVDPMLEGYAWTSGRLNAIKAVSVRSDVIETTDAGGNLLFGRLQDPKLLRQFCDDEAKRRLLDNVLKVLPNVERDGKVWVEYWGRRNDGALWRTRCPQRLANESIGTLVSNGTAVAAPALQDVRDIVLATQYPVVPPAPP